MAEKISLVRIVLKFAEGRQVSLRNSKFLSESGDVSLVNEWLERYPPTSVYPVFDLSSPDQGPADNEKASGLDRFFVIVLELEGTQIENRILELKRLPCLEEVDIEAPAGYAG